MIKKIRTVGVLLMMFLLGFVLVGCRKENSFIVPDDFSLAISTNSAIFNKGDYITMDYTLKNNVGRAIDITYYCLLSIHAPSAEYLDTYEMPDSPYYKHFKKNEVLMGTRHVGAYFEAGVHQISYKAIFYLNFGKSDEQQIEVWSNIIEITILEN